MRAIKPGDRVRLNHMPDDPDPLPAGSEGVVVAVHDEFMPQLEVRWDSGRTLYLLPDVDSFDVIGQE